MKRNVLAAAFTGAPNEPCARFRIRQHIASLDDLGVTLHDLNSSLGTFPPPGKLIRPFWGIGNIIQHIPKVIQSYKYEVNIIQREFLSTVFTLEGFTKRPRVLDVDDAIWCHRNGTCARKLALAVDHIMCGNDYLAEWFGKLNSNITIIPTAVDATYFKPAVDDKLMKGDGKKVIGWVSTSSSYPQLYKLENALSRILTMHPEAIFRIVSNLPPKAGFLSGKNVEYVKWTAEREVQVLQDIAVGIMPLEDTEFNRGKCSYKMLTYMSCEKPVVVSPVGMNKQVLDMKNIGFGAVTDDEWIDSLHCILSEQTDNTQLGKNGREVILSHFDKPIVAGKIAGVIKAHA